MESKLFTILLVFACGASENVLSFGTKSHFYPPRLLHLEDICVSDSTKVTACNSRPQTQRKPGLLRLDGVKIGYRRRVQLVPGQTHEVITRALQPPVFEIPDFLTKEECEHLMQKAEKAGLELSEVGLPLDKRSEQNSSCYDNDHRCMQWANTGECEKNPNYMKENCQLSCKICKDERAYDFENWDLDKDGVLSGHEFITAAKSLLYLYLDEDDIHEMFYVLNITQFGSGKPCDDNEDNCTYLAAEGACDEFPTWMLLTCRKSCGNCGCDDLAANCTALADEDKCLHDDYVHWMLRNCRRSCQVCIGGINYDTYHSMDNTAIFRYLKTMERNHPKHRARYSYTAWLHSTFHDHVQSKMLERVEKISQLPREIVQGAESLQIVKYDKHGHYHAHYDTSPSGDPNLICCHQKRNQSLACRLCRMVTILYYLNDVDEGGETAFVVADNSTLNETLLQSKRGGEGDPYNLSNYCQAANLVIAPKRGTAVMWYNHLLDSDSEWLGERDPYSLHGGCDVRRGNKWIANLWIPAPHKKYRDLPSIYGRAKR